MAQRYRMLLRRARLYRECPAHMGDENRLCCNRERRFRKMDAPNNRHL